MEEINTTVQKWKTGNRRKESSNKRNSKEYGQNKQMMQNRKKNPGNPYLIKKKDF